MADEHKRLQIVAHRREPDMVLVIAADPPLSDAIQVIPTQVAEAFWTHPCQDPEGVEGK